MGGIMKRFSTVLMGAVVFSTLFLVSAQKTNAAEVLTPNQMKSQMTDQDIKEATPHKEKAAGTDDLGMTIDQTQPAISERSAYPDVNNYIYQNNFKHPDITSELHQFAMFGYNTNDGKPTGVVVHYTDNPNNYSARNEANYVINGGWQSAFVHTFIDASSILNIHDTDYGAWGSGAVGNKYFAQFEMVTAKNFNDFAKTTSYSAWYTAYLLNKYKLTPSISTRTQWGGINLVA